MMTLLVRKHFLSNVPLVRALLGTGVIHRVPVAHRDSLPECSSHSFPDIDIALWTGGSEPAALNTSKALFYFGAIKQ